ncbi:MAG: hypothetical protein WCY59_06640, partial [Anaerovoracaceae bacterium]
LKAKERQREISQKYRDMVKARNELVKTRASLNRMLQDKKVNWEYKEALIELLGLAGMTKKTAKLKPGALQEFTDKQEANGEALIIDRDFIRRLQEMYYRGQRFGSMNMADVRELHNTAKQIHYAGKIHNQFIGEQRKISFEASKLRIIRAIYHNARSIDKSPTQAIPDVSKDITRTNKFFDKLKSEYAGLISPEMIIRALDGFHEMGPVYQEMWLGVKHCEDAAIQLQKEVTDKIAEIFSLIEDPKEFCTTRHAIKGFPFPLSRLGMVGWYLHSLNPYNRRALAKGYGNMDTGELLTEAQIDLPGRMLTEKEKGLARKIVEELMPILTPHTQKAYMEMNGRPMVMAEGVYWPNYPDPKLSDKIGEAKAAEQAEAMFKDLFPYVGTKFGSTIERKGGRLAPELDFIKIIQRYFSEGIQYCTHGPEVRNLLKIIKDPDFKRAVVSTLGEKAYREFTPWLKEVANPGGDRTMLWGEDLLRWLRGAETTFIMTGRLSTAIVQPTAITAAMAELGTVPVMTGLATYFKDPGKWDRFIEEHSPAAANRHKSYDREMADALRSVTSESMGRDSFMRNYRKWGMFLTSYLDSKTARVAWLSAFIKAVNGKVENVAAGDFERAADYASGVMERTQGSSSAKNRARIMRGNEYTKTLVTFFYTFFSAQFNQVWQAWGKFRSPTLDYNFMNLIKDYWLLLTIPGMVNELTRGNLPESPGEAILFPFSASGKLALSLVPGVRDISSAWLDGFTYRGGLIGNFINQGKRTVDAIRKDGKQRGKPFRVTKEVAKFLGNATGIPPDQLFIVIDELTRKKPPTEPTKPQNFIWRERKNKK